MAKLYYGNGKCTIEGSDIRGVEIRYRGNIEITDKTSDSFAISANKNGIMIFPVGYGTLNELFDYVGEFKILSVITADNNAGKVPTTIHRVMDYAELLNSNAEDLTVISEDLSAGYIHDKKVAKTTLKQRYVSNQHTSTHDGVLYLEDGTEYNGNFHVHFNGGGAMSGSQHQEDSQDLYYMKGDKLLTTKNPSGVPPAAKDQGLQRKRQGLKLGIKKLPKRSKSRGGGY